MAAGPAELAAGVRAGEPRALARAISLLERGGPAAGELMRAVGDAGVGAFAVGLTGPPGAGKSTLLSALVREARAAGERVGVVGVDPTSPFSAGALLGDRIRLAEHFLDPEVFIRSMGSRGQPGGLAAAAGQTLSLLAAAGKSVVFLETVGAGQGDLAVLDAVDAVVLVLMPGAGDGLQALKAGIMEIPDIVVVNKRDLAGAEQAARELRGALSLGAAPAPALLTTDARGGEGTAELWQALQRRRAELRADGGLARRRGERRVRELMTVAAARARRYLENAVDADPALARLLDEVRLGRLDPPSAVEQILRTLLPGYDDDDPNPR